MSVSMAVSVLTITATGFDRFLAVIYPVESRLLRTTRRAVVINISCWLIAVLIMVPRIFLYNEKKVFHIVSLVTLCYRVESLLILQIDTALNFALMYLLPLTMLSLFHFKIGKRLWYFTKPGTRPTPSGTMQPLIIKDRRRIAKIVFAITVVFALGWLPIHVYHIAEDFNNGLILFGQDIDRGTLVLLFSFGANSLNPILYCMLSNGFRQSFKKALGKCILKLSRTVHVEEGAVQEVRAHQEYRRPPPVLLPRPATTSADAFLRPHPHIHINVKQTTPLLQGTSAEFCVNNLEAVKEVKPDLSPLSDTKKTLFEIRREGKCNHLISIEKTHLSRIQSQVNITGKQDQNYSLISSISSPVNSNQNFVSQKRNSYSKPAIDLSATTNMHSWLPDSDSKVHASDQVPKSNFASSDNQLLLHNDVIIPYTDICRPVTSSAFTYVITDTPKSLIDQTNLKPDHFSKHESKTESANFSNSKSSTSNESAKCSYPKSGAANFHISQQTLNEKLMKNLPQVD